MDLSILTVVIRLLLKGNTMKLFGVIALVLLTGCASTQQEEKQVFVEPEVIKPEITELPNGDITLTILVSPSDARVRIMNIKPIYKSGIELKKGKYDIEVSKPNHKVYREWVNLAHNTELNIVLESAL